LRSSFFPGRLRLPAARSKPTRASGPRGTRWRRARRAGARVRAGR
jgi:hypothetical protein